MSKARELLVGDELESTDPEAPFPAIRVCAFDNGRVLVRDPAKDHEVTATVALSLDELYAYYDVHALLPVTDEEAGWRKLGARYAEKVRIKREDAARRAAEQRTPNEQIALEEA